MMNHIPRRHFLAAVGLLPAGTFASLAHGSFFQQGAERNSLPLTKPPRLRQGDAVALVNPAGANALRSQLEVAEESLAALGLRPRLGQHVFERYGYLAGSDRQRADDLMAQFADPEIKAIVAMRGGWGCARILPLLDFEVIRRNPKILCGYSDLTALLLGIHARTGLVTFHGPMGIGPWRRFTVDAFRRILFEGEAAVFRNPSEKGDNLTQVGSRVRTITPGTARGPLVGGNLSVFSAVVGSRFLPETDGAILFLEDVGEEIYRIDRMLTQLRLAGLLDRLKGFVFGACTDCLPGRGYGSLTLEQVFADHIRPLGIPAWQGAMIGHIPRQITLPIGVPAEVVASSGEIRLLEPAVL